MSHACHYPHCGTPTPPRLLFCPMHWAMVPPAQQAGVWAAFRATKGREERMTSIPYLTACAEAVEAVAGKLGVVGAENNTYRRLVKVLTERARPWCPSCNNQGRPFRAQYFPDKLCEKCFAEVFPEDAA